MSEPKSSNMVEIDFDDFQQMIQEITKLRKWTHLAKKVLDQSDEFLFRYYRNSPSVPTFQWREGHAIFLAVREIREIHSLRIDNEEQ